MPIKVCCDCGAAYFCCLIHQVQRPLVVGLLKLVYLTKPALEPQQTTRT